MTAAAIGKFNALHRGHRALIGLASQAGPPGMVHFTGMAEVLGWPERRPLLRDADRQGVLHDWSKELGQSIRDIAIDFASVRNMQPADFVDLLIADYDVTHVITGTDFRFGRDRGGDSAMLASLCADRGIGYQALEPITDEQGVISSSRVRDRLQSGDIGQVRSLLGRDYHVVGTVGPGDGRGRDIGFPTANLQDVCTLLPGVGVYAVGVDVAGEVRAGALNVGYLPTIGDDRPLSIEVHICDWDGDCYGQELRLTMIERIRPEKKFSSLDELISQIGSDVAAAQTIWNEFQ